MNKALPGGSVKPVLFILIACQLLLAGCSSDELMETPAIFVNTKIDLFAGIHKDRRSTKTTVFIVSGRTVSGETAPAKFYTNIRSDSLRLGVATVGIGSDLVSWEVLKKQSIKKTRSQPLELNLLEYLEFGELWTTVLPTELSFGRSTRQEQHSKDGTNQFVNRIEHELSKSKQKNIYIFVHGYNTAFDHNTEIAGEFWHYLGRDGVMLSFSWPSENSFIGYTVDKANAAFDTRLFRELLDFLGKNTSAENIHIIAHSAGNPIVVNALKEIRLINYKLSHQELLDKTKIGRVVLAAPDMDLMMLINAIQDGFAETTKGVAMYVSGSDEALILSHIVFGLIRAGEAVGHLTPQQTEVLLNTPHFYAVDVETAESNFGSMFGHSYYHKDPWVSSDIGVFIKHGLNPTDRGLRLNRKSGFWEYPKDYPFKLNSTAKRLIGMGSEQSVTTNQ